MVRTKVHVILAALCLAGITIRGLNDTVVGFLVNVLAASFVFLVEWSISSANTRLFLRLLFLSGRIRLSLSYLIVVRLEEKYLLVAGHRIPGQYQPIGGVYQTTQVGAAHLRALGATPDTEMPGDLNDLRISVPVAKVLDVVEWFETQRGREVAPLREFYEELLADEVIHRGAHEHFRSPSFEFIRRRVSRIQYSKHLKKHELLVSDIFEFQPTEKQRAALGRISDSPKATWFASEELEAECRMLAGVSTHRISNNAKWLLEGR